MRPCRPRPGLFRLVLLLAAVAVSAAVTAQERVTLRVLGEKGQIARYRGTVDIDLEAMGQKIAVNIVETGKTTVTGVAENGDVTFERVTESSEQTVNGQRVPEGDSSREPTTYTVTPRGELVAYKSARTEPDPDNVDLRLFVAQQPVFPADPVGVGDTWSHEHRPGVVDGVRAARSSYRLVAFEDAAGARCAKVEMTYAESGSEALSASHTLWVELASGDVVKSEITLENVPLPGPMGEIMGRAKGKGERIAGGPIKGTGPEASAEPEPKKIDDVVKGFERLDGFVTLYRKVAPGRQTIYMEVKKSQLGTLMMLQATAGTGNSAQVVSGNPINDLVFRFEELQKERLTVVVPNLSFRADFGTPIAEAVRRSFAESFLDQFTVEARQPERESLLIDVSDWFRGDVARVNALFQGGPALIPGFGGGRSYSLDREKTFVSSLRNFPNNLVAETTYNFVGQGGGAGLEALFGGASTSGDPRSIVVRVVYNLFPLPMDNGYRPRAFDSRVGYFTVGFQDFTKDREVDQYVQHILRWDVRKQDPRAERSPAANPVVFWLDTTIPLEYRDVVRDGILIWNRAFEAIGITDAVQVKQMTGEEEIDPGDMRYNVVRWVTSPDAGYAVALFRANPLTGQILNASITVDSNIVRFFAAEYKGVVDPADRVMVEGEHDGHHCADPRKCRAAPDGAHMARTGLIALQALGGRIDEEEYARQFTKWIVAHEFGHILGLRHNFVASAELTMEELKDKARVEEAGTSASVMDYVPFNPSALGRRGVPFFGPVLGKYDMWAVEYGYRDFGAATMAAERLDLAAIARRGNSPGLAYQTDEAADSHDPYVTRFDLGADPLNYWTGMMDLTRKLLGTLDQRQPKPGRSYWELTRDFNVLLGTHAQSAGQLARWIGGMRRSANYKGDPGERSPLAPMPGQEQRAALREIATRVLGEQAFDLPRSLFTKLTQNPNSDFAGAFIGAQNTFPILDNIANVQGQVMNSLLAPSRLARVANNEFKAACPRPLAMHEVFRAVEGAVWSEIGDARPIGQLRRELQRRHVDLLIRYSLRPPSGLPAEARMLAWNSLRTIGRRTANAAGRTTDEVTRIHLEETAMRIERALDAEETIGGTPAPSPSLLEMLLGGRSRSKP